MTTEGSPTMTTPEPLTPEEEADLRDGHAKDGLQHRRLECFTCRFLATIDALRAATPTEPRQ